MAYGYCRRSFAASPSRTSSRAVCAAEGAAKGTGRNALGLLVVGEHAREQESNDEDGTANTAGQQAIDLQDFEAVIVHGYLDAAERQHDHGHREEQPEFLAKTEVRAPEVQVRDYR